MNMDRTEIFSLIKEYFIEEFEIPEEDIKPEAELFTDLELDSIDALDMVSMLESKYEFEVDEEEVKKIRTIQDVIDFILKNIKK